ncbi:hypothetical protein HMPREF1640_12220 [Prevotella sp. S7-1-8]|uniref:hypothetical protein n=1 Tax=Prevotella sp. S7-1-8 TaxID=1284775 RepID=UPI00050EFE8B|nr:hypothetical protein [Prevotella sp. S7-1-8]KGF15384.1 hypothetical protein HMPREF1640_12220 [Prevotella sp. S7-1-8]
METIHITVSPDMIGTDYQPKTTFWMDFSIVDKFGVEAIVDTFNRAFREWQTNHVYLTELVMVLNHKIWQWYERNDSMARVDDKLWRKADEWVRENLHGEELDYFYEVTN